MVSAFPFRYIAHFSHHCLARPGQWHSFHSQPASGRTLLSCGILELMATMKDNQELLCKCGTKENDGYHQSLYDNYYMNYFEICNDGTKVVQNCLSKANAQPARRKAAPAPNAHDQHFEDNSAAWQLPANKEGQMGIAFPTYLTNLKAQLICCRIMFRTVALPASNLSGSHIWSLSMHL